ncbi:lipid droplet-associated hydrolase isoform X3 [Nomia melanderi]
MEGINMQCAMPAWDGVPTRVIAEGQWIEEDILQHGKKDIVLIIPGNPGVPDFYEGFMKSLKTKLPSEIPIWAVGHSGHVQPPNNLSYTMPSDSTWNINYSLIAQVEHKKNFINKYVPDDTNLHLIGHSIGCWMILQMLKDESISNKIKKCYLLFPTIEYMSSTPNGKFFTRFVSPISSFILFVTWVFSCLPLFLQHFLITIFAPIYGVPKKYNKAVQLLINPRSLWNVVKLAKEEMQTVKGRDDTVLSQHADKLWFYYGNCDGWTPVKYYRNMKATHPNMNAELWMECSFGEKNILQKIIDSCPGIIDSADKSYCCYNIETNKAYCCNAYEFAMLSSWTVMTVIVVVVIVISVVIFCVSCLCCICCRPYRRLRNQGIVYEHAQVPSVIHIIQTPANIPQPVKSTVPPGDY